jgi:hypothetical protein
MELAIAQADEYMGPPRFLAHRAYARSGVASPVPEAIQPGLTLLTTHEERWDWRTGILLIDETGRVLHEWQVDPGALFSGAPSSRRAKTEDRSVHGTYLFADGDLLINIEHVGIARLTACGAVRWRVPNYAHHSIARTDDGSFWIPTSTRATRPTSARYPEGYPGLNRPVNHDHLARVTEDGDVVDSISVLDLLYGNDLVRFLVKTYPLPPTDITHVNDVEPLPATMEDQYPLFRAGDLLVSLRASNLVMVVDPDTEQVKWYMSDHFVQQHDPDFIGDGWIGVFDNARDETRRGELLGGSRIVAVQPHTDSVRVMFPASESEPFYTRILGKWQHLDNGNLLLTEGTAGRVVEVDADGRTVWEWVHSGYDEARTVEVSEGARYDLTIEDVALWPCSQI